jgi:hypothetical protein
MADHVGFKHAQQLVANHTNPHTGKKYGMKAAGAILAAGARHASAGAKKANPRLRRVK